jgi:hypothetical protein
MTRRKQQKLQPLLPHLHPGRRMPRYQGWRMFEAYQVISESQLNIAKMIKNG